MTELPKVKVLIVEDQTIDALNASRYVESFGMSVLGIAKTAEKIFSIFDKCLPDIILMDINLGGEETGIEIGEAIVGTYGIPIIFTTSYSDDNTIAGALAISPYGYLVKPYGSASLETAMRVAIERRRIEDDIRESNSRFSMASNVAKLGVLEVDEASNSIFINGVENLYTFPSKMSIDNFYNLFPSEEVPKLKEAVKTKSSYRSLLQVQTDEQNTHWFQVVLSDVILAEGSVQVGAIQDISKVQHIETKLTVADKIISEVQEGILVCDDTGKIIKANDALLIMLERKRDEVLSKDILSIFPSDRKNDVKPDFLMDGKQTELSIVSKDKQRRYLMMSVATLYQDSPKQFHVAILTDITKLKTSEKQLKYLAFTDALTGAGNRNYLNNIVERYTESLAPCAIVFIDIDEFKLINDSHGHEVGDQILKACVSRLRSIIREDDNIIRFGGDEFIIITTSTLDSELESITNRLKGIFSTHFKTTVGDFKVTASIGVAVSSGSMSAGNLLKNADIAMYSAKQVGKNNVVTFDESLSKDIEYRLFIQQGLNHAISSREISAYFQPIVDAQGHVISLEALARWHVPSHGTISPDKFIPIAERTQQIHEIGLHMLEEVCIALKTLKSCGFDNIKINLNMSAVQLQKSSVVEAFTDMLLAHKIDTCDVVLEITESTLQNYRARATLTKLKKMGFKISIDDFGTGFSCISELADDIYDAIKIDRSLLPTFPLDNNSATRRSIIIENVIKLCNSLEMPCTLEGLETHEQVHFAKSIGVSAMQGYHFAKPLNLVGLMEYLQSCQKVSAVTER